MKQPYIGCKTLLSAVLVAVSFATQALADDDVVTLIEMGTCTAYWRHMLPD